MIETANIFLVAILAFLAFGVILMCTHLILDLIERLREFK